MLMRSFSMLDKNSFTLSVSFGRLVLVLRAFLDDDTDLFLDVVV